jgi:hypothetical protein
MTKRTAAIIGAVLFAAIASAYLVGGSMANRADLSAPKDGGDNRKKCLCVA